MNSRAKTLLLISQLVLSLLLAWLIIAQEWWIFSAACLLLWVLNAWALLRAQNKFERDLESTLQNSIAEDFNFFWPEKKVKGAQAQVYQLLNLWSRQLREFKQQREGQEYLLRQILDHLPFTILLLDQDKNIQVLNSGEPPLPGARNELSAEDWPRIFPFLEKFMAQKEGEVKLSLKQDGEQQLWLARKRKISAGNSEQILIILSNRQREHEQQEGEALEKILHVLTHEIMNSVSPINSLADTMKLQLQQAQNAEGQFTMDSEQFSDLQSTAQIIQRRSTGLMGFVERYARFARLPKVQKTELQWSSFLKELQTLQASELEKNNIQIELRLINARRPLYADPDLMGQVILNLSRNALEAIVSQAREDVHSSQEKARIIIELDQGDGYHYLKVIDTGPPIEHDLVDQIFLPFFSTKKRGSGIGLSLSRKIAMAHGGRLYLQQKENYKAFCLDLPF